MLASTPGKAFGSRFMLASALLFLYLNRKRGTKTCRRSHSFVLGIGRSLDQEYHQAIIFALCKDIRRNRDTVSGPYALLDMDDDFHLLLPWTGISRTACVLPPAQPGFRARHRS